MTEQQIKEFRWLIGWRGWVIYYRGMIAYWAWCLLKFEWLLPYVGEYVYWHDARQAYHIAANPYWLRAREREGE